jgi:hypothetical protein
MRRTNAERQVSMSRLVSHHSSSLLLTRVSEFQGKVLSGNGI